MIRLDATTRKLQVVLSGAVAATEPDIVVSYSDKTATTYTGGSQASAGNGTTPVDICAAPAASTVRDVDHLVIRNNDSSPITLTVRYNDNSTIYKLITATLAVGDALEYTHATGFRALDSSGNLKQSAARSVVGPSSSTDNAVSRWDGTSGLLVQDSVVTIGDTGAVAGVLTLNKVTITTPASGSTLTIADGKTLTVSNTVTITATDGSTLAVGSGAALSAIGALTPAADRLAYFTGAAAGAVTTYTAGARALDGLTYAADKIGYTTSASAAATTDLTSVARTLIAQTTQATMRSTGLGLDTLTQPLMNYGGMNFNGTTTYLDSNALTGIADGKKGSFAIILRASATGATERILQSTGDGLQIIRTSTGELQVTAENAAGTTILNKATTTAPLASAGTYVILISYDLAVPGSMRVYINDVAATLNVGTFTDDTIDYTVAEYSIGGTTGGGNLFSGDMYLFWFDPTTAQDFSSAAVRRKFTDPNNVPQFLGSHGELPTGTPPILFLGYSEFQNWSRNRGLATTAFTENGTPAAPTTILYGQAGPVDNVARAAVRTTNVGNVGSGEDNLITYVLPANRLITRDCGVRITAWGTTANNANAKTLKVYFGSQVVLTFAFTTSQANVWRAVAEVMSTGVDTQDYVAQIMQAGTAAASDVESGTATQDDGAAITIKCTGEATSNNDIVQEGLIVELIGI